MAFGFTKLCILLLYFIPLLHTSFTQDITNFHRMIFNGDKTALMEYKNNQKQIISNQNSKTYTLTVDADFKMEGIWILSASGSEYLNFTKNTQYIFKVASDSLQIFTNYYQQEIPYQHTVFYKEAYINNDLTITIKKVEANKTKYFNLLRAENITLLLNQIDLVYRTKKFNGGIVIEQILNNRPYYILRYNNFPNKNISCEWAVKGKQRSNNGDIYILNGQLKNSDIDSIVQNNPLNYKHAHFHYSFPDSIMSQIIHVGFFPFGHYYLDDPVYKLPLNVSIYQDTSASIDLIASKFWQQVDLHGSGKENLESAQMRIGNGKIYGYTSKSSYDKPFILSETEDAYFGFTPTYWFGKYINQTNTIRIRGDWGIRNDQQLFLSQSNDVLPQYPPKIQISNQDSVILEKEILSELFTISIAAGYVPDSLRFPVPPDKYKVVVMNDKSEVAHKPAITKATAVFDLRNEDKNPPNMILFQILSGDRINNIITPATKNTIRFKLEDDDSVSNVQLFYRSENDLNWSELPLSITELYYQTEIPVLSFNYYSLKINAEDPSGNSISIEMVPAFFYSKSTSIKVDKHEIISSFKLYQNFPNPFNPTTTIKYALPKSSYVELKIYDLIGREIKTLVSGNDTEGYKEVVWDGRNNSGEQVSSGIYFYHFKASSTEDGKVFEKSAKLMLLK
ncbi:MAG: T9SS type A sorting domain-containing protein [Ignavibacteriales bacterium]|nr:T9SS type A sorting domain-containing protein [Ignavibacteriales bacterium]